MTILLTAIGTASAQAVIQSLRQSYPGVRIIGTDLNRGDILPTSKWVDRFVQVPPGNTDGYATLLVEICRNESVDYLIPLTDPEVDALSGMEARFRLVGTVITQSEPASIRISRDKRSVHDVFANDRHVNVIPTWNQSEITATSPFPLLAKKRKGRSSEGIVRYVDFEQWADCCERSSDHIVQPLLDGEVHTVDVVRSKSGETAVLARKELIRNPRGLGLVVDVQPHSELNNIARYVAQKLNLIGAVNIEFLIHAGTPYLMDVNPRISGGVHFSIQAGFDVAKEHMAVFRVWKSQKHHTFQKAILT